MASIEEILDGMEVEDYYHDKIQFTIDENLRIVSVPNGGNVIGVVGDKDVNRVNFIMPRYYNGFDMSTFETRVNYTNSNGNANYYVVDDSQVLDNYILFTWLVGSDVTAYKGTVKFAIRMVKMESEEVVQSFNTTIASGVVLDGLNIDSIIEHERDKLSEKTEFGNLVCFADSIGQGQNNNDYSYIDILEKSGRFNSVTKAAVGSATFGVYPGVEDHPSLKWAVGSSFYEQVRKSQYQDAITNANNIVVQYMANDVLAILAGYIEIGTPEDTDETTICGMVKSSLDYILNINPSAIITWISLFNSEKNISYYATAYKSVSDKYSFGYTYDQIANTAKELNDAMFILFTNYNCNIMPILEGKPFNSNNSSTFFSSDNVHPNTLGHEAIAKQCLKTLRGGQEISWNEILYRLSNSSSSSGGSGDNITQVVEEGKYKKFTMTITSETMDSGTTDVTMAQLLSWHEQGYEIKGICNMSGIDLVFNIATVYADSNYITMSTNVMTSNTAGAYIIFTVELYSDNAFSNVKAFDIASTNVPISTIVDSISST